MTPPRLTLACLLAVLAAAAPGRGALWVSASGDDSNPGTEEQPFRTLVRARDAVRALNRDMADDTTVFVSGVQRLASPLVLGPEDGATNGLSIVYTASPGEHPVITGAFPVAGWRREDAGQGLWSAPAPAGMSPCADLRVDGFAARRAQGRIPVAGPPPKWRSNPGLIVAPASPDAVWSERAAGQLAENAPELLSQPGDWCLDTVAGRILYLARPGEDPSSEDIEAASASALVVVRGEAGKGVAGLVFKGLQFEGTGQADADGGAVRVLAASSVQFLEDRFIHLGGAGLELGASTEAVNVEGCLFADIAGAALVCEDASHVTLTQSRLDHVSMRRRGAPAVRLARTRVAVLSHLDIVHYPLRPVAADMAAAELNESDNHVSAPLFGPLPWADPELLPGPGVTEAFAGLGAQDAVRLGPPAAPGQVAAEPEDGFAYVTWDPPCDDGGQPVLGYSVACSSAGALEVSAADFLARGYVVFAGLPDGDPATFTVRARSAAGTGPASAPSEAVVPARKHRAKVPAPLAASLAPAYAGSLVSIRPAPAAPSPVVAYVVTVSPAGTRFVVEGRDVIRATPSAPLVRFVPGLLPARGSTVLVSSVNARGTSEAVPATVPW